MLRLDFYLHSNPHKRNSTFPPRNCPWIWSRNNERRQIRTVYRLIPVLPPVVPYLLRLTDSETQSLKICLDFHVFLQILFGCLVPSFHLCHQFWQSSTMIAIRFLSIEFVNVPTPSPKLTTSCNSNWVMLLGICSFPWRWCPEVLYLC